MSFPTLYHTVKNNRFLYKFIKPFADYYANLAGYRQLGVYLELKSFYFNFFYYKKIQCISWLITIGLRYDDIIIEENSIVEKALKRLPQEEHDLRNFRIRQAFQLSLTHTTFPKEKWTKPEEVN